MGGAVQGRRAQQQLVALFPASNVATPIASKRDFWFRSITSFLTHGRHFRFATDSRSVKCAAANRHWANFRLIHRSNYYPLFDHLVGATEQRGRTLVTVVQERSQRLPMPRSCVRAVAIGALRTSSPYLAAHRRQAEFARAGRAESRRPLRAHGKTKRAG